jgi:hypothetical protein
VTRQVEIEISGESGVTLGFAGGCSEPWEGVRVRHRDVGTRRWSKFLVQAPPGQTLRETIAVAIAVVGLDEDERAKLRQDGQLRLDGLEGAFA